MRLPLFHSLRSDSCRHPHSCCACVAPLPCRYAHAPDGAGVVGDAAAFEKYRGEGVLTGGAAKRCEHGVGRLELLGTRKGG